MAQERAVAALKTGDSYEAQQLFKSAYHRQRKRGVSPETAYITLQEGAQLQLAAGQITCGVELSLLLLSALEEDKVVPDSTSIGYFLPIVSGLLGPAESSSSSDTSSGAQRKATGPPSAVKVDEAERVVFSIASWATKSPVTSAVALRRMHAIFAEKLWQAYGAADLQRVAVHAARGDDTALYAKVLKSTTPAEPMDVVTTEAVLQVLVLARTDTSPLQLAIAKRLLVDLGAGSEDSSATQAARHPPLMNFLTLLLEALEKRSIPLVRLLRDRYRPALSVSEGWEALLERIAAVYCY
mmetsp:Transcript_2500/g.4206  ORF Transcript_2500/g.4206 Transcript_2500/m.4206 type:complete len:297 (+) Transcript_2500:233-1123(+)|eukprot:CAMPEP_0119111478 /NCGR_PEP_ID=MMETSP1180-20130426/35757_1 /TAXON_ID=3052 ORGANISM="Chlamydomonas cf sp, Strain CCMP681" /NCGR_SAMPLE_ID=MMETSP1180 /ASSEMBLY_ACC=CAM_ASM_000741 /LENGTH=296 /DNA_ID=CAMNT_0007098455 /DNA_START=142 /DNA_END=1032 /DNA_ORIENTATION=-